MDEDYKFRLEGVKQSGFTSYTPCLKEQFYNVTRNSYMKRYYIFNIFLIYHVIRKYIIKEEKAIYFHRRDVSWRTNYSQNLDKSTPSDDVRADTRLF